jgi:hypothetical protein
MDQPGEKAIRLHEQAITEQQKDNDKKITIDIRRRLYQAIVVNIVLWGSESRALKEANRSKLEAFHHGCLCRM